MDIRLIALDVDDTILTRELFLPQATRTAIAQAQEAGVVVTLATGRMFASVKPHAESLKIQAPLITYNGALVKTLAGQVVAQQLIPKAGVIELAEMAQEEGLTLNVYVDDELHVERFNEAVAFYLTIAKVEPHVEGDLVAYAKRLPDDGGALKGLLVVEPDQAKHLLPKMQERYRGRFEVVMSHERFIEFMAPDISKGRALAALCSAYGISREHVMAAGDNFNDITMLQYAGLGVAVSNAPEPVRQAADVVVGTAAEAGIADAIQRFVLGACSRT